MNKPLLFVLQVYEGDIGQATKLARLLADIRGDDNPCPEADALLAYRRDCAQSHKLEALLEDAFGTLRVFRSSRREVGFPGGPNGLWCDTLQHIAVQQAHKAWEYEVALTTEADAVPLVQEWAARLLVAWRRAKDIKGKVVVAGHWLPTGEHECGHINGNCLVDTLLATMDPAFVGCAEQVAWDTWFALKFKALGWANIPEIRSLYRENNLQPDKVEHLVGNGCAWLHGIKDESTLVWARRNLVKNNC